MASLENCLFLSNFCIVKLNFNMLLILGAVIGFHGKLKSQTKTWGPSFNILYDRDICHIAYVGKGLHTIPNIEQIWPVTYYCTSHELRIVLAFLNAYITNYKTLIICP